MQRIGQVVRQWLIQRLLAVLLFGVLLCQPIFCVIHYATDAHRASVVDHLRYSRYFLCTLTDSLSPPTYPTSLPAFWPSLPYLPPAIAVTVLLPLLLLIARPPTKLRSISWLPPLPPPRLSIISVGYACLADMHTFV